MDKDKILEITSSIQEALYQMRADDIEECGEDAFEEFYCECCGEDKIMAGSVIYNNYRLCNDCALLAEVAFALEKIKDIEEFLVLMEDKRLQHLCEYVKEVHPVSEDEDT